MIRSWYIQKIFNMYEQILKHNGILQNMLLSNFRGQFYFSKKIARQSEPFAIRQMNNVFFAKPFFP